MDCVFFRSINVLKCHLFVVAMWEKVSEENIGVQEEIIENWATV